MSVPASLLIEDQADDDALLALRGLAKAARAERTMLRPISVKVPLRRPKVLCIDDDPDITKAIKLRLESYSVDVQRAFDGMQGYWMALDMKPDVVISDMHMPDGEGNYILGRLRSHSITKNVPVVILTGRGNQGLKRQLLKCGAAAYLTKPLNFEELLRELRQWIALPTEPCDLRRH